ncbi:hypothetical protein MBT84_45585 [Streptomyces sp. MBT84]|nr:hypothetical protein [Streptomyces sp. MBT84]
MEPYKKTVDAWLQGHPLCLIGDSATRESHLLIALGTAVAMAGYRVHYTPPPRPW